MALAYTDDGPRARVFLTYGETEDRSSDIYTEATEAFSAWCPPRSGVSSS